jgi:hypothetical protein
MLPSVRHVLCWITPPARTHPAGRAFLLVGVRLNPFGSRVAVRHSGGLLHVNARGQSLADAQSMERIDWVYALSLAASLGLAVGAMYVLFFWM